MDLEKIGEKLGFFLMFIVATIILFFILKIFDKIPFVGEYSHVLILVLLIVLLGMFIKRVLK